MTRRNTGSVSEVRSRFASLDSMESSSGLGYSRLHDGFIDSQFHLPEQTIPWKAIGLATTLFILGSTLIIIGALLLSGFISAEYSDRTWPVLILGIIMFIPGFYHVRIAYYAFKGYQGYSFDDIPDFN
ncbi:UPF0414 transmembrane protein C20orf30 homolog [Trichuris trichiura]|uniref:Transmembrane protein 230 n=1 Tax=Trichuris trichiura TaxID=36087 RepID=A0A077Z0A1_TRITR|nr:UPF0414 transmembrane protein C20orf30 homolog [Trichuris trichiura]